MRDEHAPHIISDSVESNSYSMWSCHQLRTFKHSPIFSHKLLTLQTLSLTDSQNKIQSILSVSFFLLHFNFHFHLDLEKFKSSIKSLSPHKHIETKQGKRVVVGELASLSPICLIKLMVEAHDRDRARGLNRILRIRSNANSREY